MFGKLFWKIASLKTSWSEKSDKYRSSRSQMFFKIAGIKDFAIFTGKHLCWSLFGGLRACSFVGGRLRQGCFLWARLWWLLLLVAVAVWGGGVAAVVRGMYGAGSGFGGGVARCVGGSISVLAGELVAGVLLSGVLGLS